MRHNRSRRDFVRDIGAAVGGAAAIGMAGGSSGCMMRGARKGASNERAARTGDRRRHASASLPLPADPTNGDDQRYATRFASFTKGLPHNDAGEVDAAAYKALVTAIMANDATAIGRVPLGGALQFVNPRAAHAYAMCGVDPDRVGLPAPPAFASAEAAANMVELYWQARLRDVPFDQWPVHPAAADASADLSRLTAYRGPKSGGHVVPAVLFRGTTDGDLAGPYVSQFLYGRVPQGVYTLEQKFRVPVSGGDYLTSHDEWLAIQRGGAGVRIERLATPRYMTTGRDLGEYVRRDFTYQGFLNAALILIRFGPSCLNGANPYTPRTCSLLPPYATAPSEAGFCTFGAPHILDAVASVANLALLASWRQKWLLHRTLRPEVFAQRVHRHMRGEASYPIHRDLLSSAVVERQGSHQLLSSTYPDGAPAHPSYPSGHAAIAGACTTVLKAFSREDADYPAPVQPSEDGMSLVPYAGLRLTIGGELDKLAFNIAMGRNFAGIHYRFDAADGLRLGEAVALAYLRDMRNCLPEDFDGFTVMGFDGTPIDV
jgi:membrane-associated phospholipid phosphatase